MPIIKSAIKRARQQEKRRTRNVMIKTGVKIKVKSAHSAIASDPKSAHDAIIAAISEIDRATKKGAMHKNTASRKKSRLTLAYNSVADKPYGTEKVSSKPKNTNTVKKPATKSTTKSVTKKATSKKS